MTSCGHSIAKCLQFCIASSGAGYANIGTVNPPLPLLSLLCLLTFSSTLSAQESGPASFYNVTDIVQNWSPQQHLWVKGNLNVSASKLSQLEDWLDQHGPNWTVVLMQTAAGQKYDGKTGMSAVEFALGTGLSNQTGFGDLSDPRSGQPNGAVFILFLKERKFSYFGAEAFDSRSLGERYWVGRLDKPAISAMRSGGRILDAAKNTVSSIETALTRKIQEESERKRLTEIKKQQAIDEAKLYPSQLRSLIQEASGRATELRKKHDGLIGPIVRPDIVAWTAESETIERLAHQSDYNNARQHFTDTQNAISSFHGGLDQWERSADRFAWISDQIQSHPAPEQAPAVAGHLASAKQAIMSSQANHRTGEPLYREQLNTAERSYALAHDRYEEWLQAERQRKQLFRAGSLASILALLVFLGVANRLRRPARDKALKLFENWQDRLSGKFDNLFQLMDRAGLVVGSSQDLDERGFAGTTEALARETIHGVDELFIMSSATDHVMEEVKSLIRPTSLFPTVFNAYSSRRYRKAISLLTKEPIGFDEHEHLEAILRPVKEAPSSGPSRTLLGETADYPPFRISFEKLIAEYDDRQVQTFEGVARLEAGIDGLPLTQQELIKTLDRTDELASGLAVKAESDTFFPLNSLRDALIPAASSSLGKAGSLGETDPVEAFESLIPESSRLVGEATSIATTIEMFRITDLPIIERTRSRLHDHDRKTEWIDNSLRSLTERSEEFASSATSRSIADDWAGFGDALIQLKGDAQNCKKQTQRATEEVTPLIKQREEDLKEARSRLSTQLHIDASHLLNEPGLAPAERIEQARQSVRTAITSINNGHPDTATQDLTEAESALEESAALMMLCQTSADDHGEKLSELSAGHETVSSEVTPAEALLEEMRSDYAPAILLFSSRLGEDLDGQQSIIESIERANRRLLNSADELEESRKAFSDGELIRAYSLLETVANELDFARHQLALIHDQHSALKEIEVKNSSLADSLRTRLRELAILASDRRTSQSTIDSHASGQQDLETFSADLGGTGKNPFEQHRNGLVIESEVNAVEDGIGSDWKTFELAESSATGAKAALTFCHTYLREAHTDGIPDSRALTRAISRHGELTTELEKIEVRLDHAHADWNALFVSISAVTGETAKVRSTLQSQLAAARDAAEELARASKAIADLHKWRSSYSVNPSRKAGKPALRRAKQALFKGEYANARKASIGARGEAILELQRAKTKEARKENQAAAAARRAAFSSRSSLSSSSSFSSGFSSSSSGFSSSSFSSGSGFSRSGW